MPDENEKETGVSSQDIIFECSNCGRNLVIDYRAAGLSIRCPECDHEILVPIPQGMDISDIDRQLESQPPNGLEEPVRSATPIDPAEQLRNLTTELEELRFRRRYLEKEHAEYTQLVKDIGEQITGIRSALNEIEALLQRAGEKTASDTQTL